MTQQVKPAYRKPAKPKGSIKTDRLIRTIRAYFIEARGHNMPHQQAGYMRAILSLSTLTRNLANWEETIIWVTALSRLTQPTGSLMW